jgi:hypothetical protein
MEADIYYVDTRNADPRDHRVVRPGTLAPARAIVVPAAAPGAESSRVYQGPMPMGSQPAAIYPNTQFFGQGPVYAQPPVFGPPYGHPPYGGPFMGTLGALFGGVNIGQLIELIGQGFAALKALPGAPSSTGDVATDVANLTLYQRSLAEHGKLDEQIRTGVHIVAKLLGA